MNTEVKIMLQTLEAVIDTRGRVSLLEKVKLSKKHRALVTILDDTETAEEEMSIFGSMELVDEDLEGASRQIAEMINQSIEKTAREINGE
jgi:hypothetical protein